MYNHLEFKPLILTCLGLGLQMLVSKLCPGPAVLVFCS